MLSITQNRTLTDLTSLRQNHRADFYTEVESAEQLFYALNYADDNNLEYCILGGGSNLLFRQDYKGLIIKLGLEDFKIENKEHDKVFVHAGAGIDWHKLVRFTVEKGWYGLENLSLIPGTVGAAPIQNIGAYGVELQEVFYAASGIDLQSGQLEVLYKEDCNFGYRDSIFKKELKGQFIITRVILDLNKKGQSALNYGRIKDELGELEGRIPSSLEVSDAVIRIRNSKLPDPETLGNAGSFFKNPIVSPTKLDELLILKPKLKYFKHGKQYKLSAAWLIEECNWKGKRIGDAGVYDKHSLILVNYGAASGADILNLAGKIEKDISNAFGIRLEKEVNVI